jgi:cyclopropane fatty-acyl-phospholipid synthase-like methyltransferase
MDLKQHYWEEETLKYNWPHARLLLIAEAILHSSPGSSVLDLGAGKALLARLIGTSYRYLGLDIVGGTDADVRVEACDFDNLEQFHFQGGPFDIAVASGLLEYLNDWRGFLRNVTANWLSRQGLLLVSFTNMRGYRKAPVQKHPEWKNVLTLPEILKELDTLDLVVERVYPLLWGNKRVGLPFVKALAALATQSRNFQMLDRPWVSQFLCIARPRPRI